jgi:hypothetical protein
LPSERGIVKGRTAIRVEKPADIGPAIEHAIKAEKTYIVDLIVDTEAGSPSIGTLEFQPFPHRNRTLCHENFDRMGEL